MVMSKTNFASCGPFFFFFLLHLHLHHRLRFDKQPEDFATAIVAGLAVFFGWSALNASGCDGRPRGHLLSVAVAVASAAAAVCFVSSPAAAACELSLLPTPQYPWPSFF